MLNQASDACVSRPLPIVLLMLTGKDIKTYAVTPLNEECGLIEWVDNLRTLRDLVIKLLRERGITPNVRIHLVNCLQCLLTSSVQRDQTLPKRGLLRYLEAPLVYNQSAGKVRDTIPPSGLADADRTRFPPVLHEWFVEMFPEAGSWFAARLRYTRSCAVMSMVGYVLGYAQPFYGRRSDINIGTDWETGMARISYSRKAPAACCM